RRADRRAEPGRGGRRHERRRAALLAGPPGPSRPSPDRPRERRAGEHRRRTGNRPGPDRAARRGLREVSPPLPPRRCPPLAAPRRGPGARRRQRRDPRAGRPGRGRRGGMNLSQHLFWITSRAAGTVAMLLTSASVVVGLMISSRRRGSNKSDLRAIHEALSLTALAMVALHGTSLLGDAFLNPGLSGIAVPFASAYRPLWTGI